MEPTPKYLAADLMLGGKLAEFLKERRGEGVSFDRLATDLYVATERKVHVSGVTVASWCDALGIPRPEKPEKASA